MLQIVTSENMPFLDLRTRVFEKDQHVPRGGEERQGLMR